jgi:hypothetical protein
MRNARLITTGTTWLVATLALALEARAQVCMGLPSREGQIAVQAEVSSRENTQFYGGRLAMNFNTEYALDFAVRRPQYENGLGLTLYGGIGYEMEDYKPPVCFLVGVRHARIPRAEGKDSTLTMVPIAVGVGKRLGSARGLSLSLFVLPEYIYVAQPKPETEETNFWRQLGQRSQGRGVAGLVLATPLIFVTGSAEVSTLDKYVPTFTVGFGLLF